MKRCFKIIAATAVALSIVSCAKPYDITPISKSDAAAAALPAGTDLANVDSYVLHVLATTPAGVNFVSDQSYGMIRMAGIGYNDVSNVLDLKVTIAVDRVKKTAGAVIKVVYANESDYEYTVTLSGGVAQGTATTMSFSVKDDYTSGVLVNVNVQGAVATVSMRETNPLYNANGAFLNNVTFQVNPAAQ